MRALLRRRRDGTVRAGYKLWVTLRALRPPRGGGRRRARGLEASQALWLAQYSQLPRQHRRQARRVVRRAARRNPHARRLYASIASPHGVGKDGQLAYDLDTRTWFGTMVGSIIAAGKPWVDITAPNLTNGGAKGDKITDDTPAIANAIALAPVGGVVFAPRAPVGYLFSTLSISKSLMLVGEGFTSRRDFLTTFGDANYSVTANFGGSVFYSTATAGAALACTTTETNMLNVLGILIVGPGSGTSTGIAYGNAAHAIVQSRVDVGVMNFSTGVAVVNVEDADVQLLIRGCTTGLTLATSINQNTWRLDVEQCGTGYTDDASCLGNVFINPLFQGNTGTSMVLNGQVASMYGGWFENAAGTRALDCQGSNNTFDGVFFSHTTDAIRVGAVASTIFRNIKVQSPGTPFVDNGQGTMVTGQLGNLTFSGTGTRRVFSDPTAAQYDSDGGGDLNDADTVRWEWESGADVTLGPLRNSIYAHPSAVGANRYWAFRAGDNSAFRQIRINDTGGGVQLGAGVRTLDAGGLSPSTAAIATQAGQVFQGSGVPSNANGNNGDVYFRTDTPATVNQRIYVKSAGAWVGIL